MKRRLKRKSNKKMIFILIGSILTIAAVIFTNLNYLNKMKTDYQEKIKVLTKEYKTKEVIIYEAKEYISAGTVLTYDVVHESTVTSAQSKEYYMTSENIGHVALIDIQAGTWILKDMLNKDSLSDQLREVEYTTFFIGNNIMQNDYFDLHIQYPNGEDYVVLSKTSAKRIDEINQYLYLWLSPEELFLVSGAIVDCYLNEGARLYSVKYIEPTIQKASYLTYTPNTDIIQLMKKDPNIVNIALNTLSNQVRLELEERLNLFYCDQTGKDGNEVDGIYYPSERSIMVEDSMEQSLITNETTEDLVTNNEEVYYVD